MDHLFNIIIFSIQEYIQSVDFRKERTLIICNEIDEAKQVAQCFDASKIPHDLVRDDTECKTKPNSNVRFQNIWTHF